MSKRIIIITSLATIILAGIILAYYLPILLNRGKGKLDVAPLAQSVKTKWAELLIRLCWIAYSPTHFNPTANPPRWPSEQDIREDLRVLRRAGFNGLVTYGSNYRQRSAPDRMLDIPRLAQAEGFAGMIVGVWNPADEVELQAAEQSGQHAVVLGYCVGNEGLDVRYDLKKLIAAMDRLRRTTDKPVSTSEEVSDYYENSPLWKIADWTFPNVHPYFAKLRDPQEAAQWTESIFKTLSAASSKPLIFKEVGLPSCCDVGLNEARQAKYYKLLCQSSVIYVVFEAFDAPWKHLSHPKPKNSPLWPDPEPHWGVFTSNRKSKAVAKNPCRCLRR